ncbi:MAG: hypothetical protein J6X62_01050 [Bacteroidales bacterium]|nr:hypothetical protein [Bacteroidales bacterium]
MKKALLLGALICAIGMLAACKSGTANEAAVNTIDTDELTWASIDEKLSSGAFPAEAECMFILSDTTLDEGHSEGVGNNLFNLLRGNQEANELFSSSLKGITSEERGKSLSSLMSLMSIDIALAEYGQYEDFLIDFPLFRGCAEAEDEFNLIKENGI